LGTPHTGEIRFVFGGPEQKFVADEAPTSKAMNAYWAAFAKTSDPGAAGGVKWPKFDAAREASLEFANDGVHAREHHLKPRLDWVEANMVGAQ
jgi:para-nitrobenzyl esterase